MIFLDKYGTANRNKQPRPRRIHWGNQYLIINKDSKEPNNLALQSLKEKSQTSEPMTQQISQRNALKTITRFSGGQLECGKYEFVQGRLTFMSHFKDYRNGSITIGRKQAIVLLGEQGGDQLRIDMDFHHCEDVVLETCSVIFNLKFAPKIYLIEGEDNGINALMQNMGLSNGAKPQKPGRRKKIRLPAMSNLHAAVTGACWTYRFMLTNRPDLSTIRGLLRKNGRMCSVHLINARVQSPSRSFDEDFKRLQYELTMTTRFGSKPFPLRFQLDRLARNGYLTPQKVVSLLPRVSALLVEYGLQPVLSAVRRLSREIPFAGPEIESKDLSLGNLEETLELYCAHYDEFAPNNPYELAKRYAHVNLVHKITITPSGVRLEGPEPEPTNRVLRSYPHATDAFIRVEFRDDDGAQVRHDGRTDLKRIYHERFKGVLDGNVIICGSGFSFLGFSHSSLRSQSCWFMRPFVDRTKEMVLAELLLKRLGDFESIRTPAKVCHYVAQYTW